MSYFMLFVLGGTSRVLSDYFPKLSWFIGLITGAFVSFITIHNMI